MKYGYNIVKNFVFTRQNIQHYSAQWTRHSGNNDSRTYPILRMVPILQYSQHKPERDW